MPSEAQSQEPRDRGPAPPVTRAGRSAQLAKAAATSPAPERRPRGRPRKDGSGSRSAPPAPPTPPPPPPPKSRKKGRSRGRAQVEDEESMDATEKKPPQKTELKEKTPGRRRSTSRRKSNINPAPAPEPSQDRLTPEPEPDPDPPHRDPTVAKSSPQPPPSAEEEDRTSSAPAAPIPTSSPGRGPQVNPPPPSPDLSPVYSPASRPSPPPDPVEGDRPSPIHGPSHSPGHSPSHGPIHSPSHGPIHSPGHSPGPAPMETEGGAASPLEQILVLSPCSSPPVSPCPRLDDDDSLSPLSEDSGASPTPSLGHTKKRLKQCAFCYRGDAPPLGQGRLVVFGPTPGYIPLHILNRRASSDRDNDCHDHCYRGDQALLTCGSPEQCEESSSEFVEQLGPVGLPHDINVQSLFDFTGQCCAHLQCAAWSEGVCRGEGQSLLYVDKAIDLGSTQVCAFCRRLGASLRCQEMSCGRSYHFPCAAAAGAHQDWTQRHTLCTRHTHTVSSQCVLCSGGGDVSGLLMCCCCGDHYHGSCLDPPLVPSSLCRAGWQCHRCRTCQSCRLRGDDGVLLVCDRCDKAYHTHCLTPPLDHTPSTSWTCKNCRICRRCGVRSSGQWANHPFLCESCDLALPCPLCDHAPDLDTPQDYLTCICCYRCVHTECVVQAGEGRAGSETYVCSTCRPQEEELISHASTPHSPTLAMSLSSTQAPSISFSQPPIPGHAEAQPISHTTDSPVQLVFSEQPQSPAKTLCTSSQESLTPSYPEPMELQLSPAPSHPEPSGLHLSPAPSHPEPMELQPSPAPSQPEPSELQLSPAPSHPDPLELQHSPAPSHPEPTELQHSPATSHPEPTELQHNPAPSHPEPTELQHSPAPSHPEPPELQHSPAPSHPEPTELQHSPAPSHPELTELQHSPAPSYPEPTELQHSPAPSHPELTELQHSPAPSHPEPTELQHSPAPSHPELTELQHSPAPSHPEPTELQHSPAPSHPDPLEPQLSPARTYTDPTELQLSPTPSHPDPLEPQLSPAPTYTDPTELQHSPAPSHPDPLELHLSPASSNPESTELQHSPAPSHPDHIELKHSPAPSHSGPTDLKPSPAPSHPDPLELQHSPAPSHPEPEELQHSPAPSHSEDMELQTSPVSSHPEPTEFQPSLAPSRIEPEELQHSPVPSEPMEFQHGPAQSHSELMEVQHSLAPSNPEPEVLQHGPEPSRPEPTELQRTPEPSEPKELQHSPAPSHPESTEHQHSPVPSNPEPMKLQPSPAPSHSEPIEPQPCPAPSHPEPTEPQPSPAQSHPEPTELQTSPTPSHLEPTEPQPSPAPSHLEPTELQTSPAPSHVEPIELQPSPVPPHPEQTNHQRSPVLSQPETSEIPASSATSPPEHPELQCSPAPSCREQIDHQRSPAPTQPVPTEFECSTLLSGSNPKELQQSPLPSQLDHTELETSPSASYLDTEKEFQQSCTPSQPGLTEHQESHTSPHLSPAERRQSPTQSHSGPAQPLKSLMSCPEGTAELQKCPTQVTLIQAQHSPHQLICTSHSHTQNSTEDQLMATESQLSPTTQGFPMSRSYAHSPHSPTKTGLSPSQALPGSVEPQQSLPPHSLVQDYTSQTQLNRLCSTDVITQPHHSPPQRRHSPIPSPAQVGTSLPQSPTEDIKLTLDQENPGSSSPAQLRLEAAGDISTLDHDLSPVYLRSAQTPRRCTSLRPNSAPCSPSPAPLRATQCSLSQPASPVLVHSSQTVRPQLSLLSSQLATQSRVTKECTQTSTMEMKSLHHNPMQLSPNLDGQTLESCPGPDSHGTDGKPNQLSPLQSSALSPDHSSPLHIPAMPKPESLVHNSTSMEHSSLTCSPCADETEVIPPLASHSHQTPSGDSPSRCTEAIEGEANLIHIQNSSASSRPKHASQMPTSPARSLLACASPIQMVTSPTHVSNLVQPINPVAPPVKSLIQPASPLAVLARPAHTISCQVEEMEVAIDHPDQLTSHLNSSPDSSGHTTPVHTETNNGDSMRGSLHAQERTDPSVCRFASQSPTHHSQSSPSYVRSTCSPSQSSAEQKSPLSSPASFSPQHCRLTDANPASSSVSHSLSHSGQTTSQSVSLTDVTVIHSPPRSSPAGQASPFHIQSTSSSAHSGPVQRQTPSLASTPHSSPAPANIACVSPPHSPAQSTERYFTPIGSPHCSPRPDTGTSSSPTVAQLSPTVASPDVDLVASPVQTSVLHSVVQLDSDLLRPVDSIRQTSPKPASSLIDDSSAVSPNQACPSPVSHSQVSPLHTTDASAVESQQSNASGSPQYERSATPVDATSTQSTLNHASPVHSSPTQDNTAMPSTCSNSETSYSSAPSQVSSSQTLSPQTQQAQASSVHSSPVASPDLGPMQSSITQINPSPVAASPVRPEACPSPGPGSPLRFEFSPVTSSVSPVFANSEQSETTAITGPTSPLQPDADGGPGCPSMVSPQQHTQMEAESVATLGICVVQEEMLQERKTEEEKKMEGEALQQEEAGDSYQTKDRPEEEKLVDSAEEGGEQELEGEEDQRSSSNCPPAGVQLGSVLKEDHQSSPHTEAAASPVLSHSAPHSPQTITPLSALLPQQPSFSLSSSPPVSPFTSPQSPPPPLSRAGSLEASPSSPHRTALLTSSSPPLEVRRQEEEVTNQRQAEMGKGVEAEPEDKTLSCHVTSVDDDSQSQSQFEPVARATEPTKDEHQSLAEPSDGDEEPPDTPEPTASHGSAASDVVSRQQPMREEEEEQGEGPSERMGEDQVDDAREGTLQVDQSDGEEEEPVSPVLELDPSLDMEVMELMASSPPPSLLHLSSPSLPTFSRRGKGRSLRRPPCPSRPSDDLSIRLRQSPFSTEASPETSPVRIPITPPPLSPLSPSLGYSPPDRESPPLSKPQAPTTILPLTPKIGMGKPAITKRKFSPGRARIKQGSWWNSRRAVSPPSSSQDSMGEGGWDSPKPRPPDSPLWSMRVGRGSGFPGRRRSRGGGVGAGRGARGRSRLKTQDCLTVSPGSVYVEPFQPKEEEENSMHNTVVMFSTSDHFTLRQDMCVVCGSFGQGAEGRLLACSQCGQCYHPYCVNVKITRVVLTKGWRCLECTVCEACGEASDPGRLLLCDDCDISYHTYCLDPPLHTVPKGAWKCKWCVWCVQCGSSSPGLHCDWQNNYSRCGPCDSLSRCPLCQRQYSQDDLILQCQQCDRWVHAVCQGLTTEEEVEVAADEGFDCSLCRTHSRSSLGRSDSFESPYMAQIISRIREPDTKTYTQDGVCLTESGLSHLQSLVEPLTSPRRYRRCKPKLKLRIINQNSVSVLQTPSEPEPPTEQDHSRGDLECEMKSDSSPERDHAHDDDITKEPEVTDGNKKRKRKPYRPGIGGFMVRQRGGKAGPSRIKLCRKDSTETLLGRDEDVSMETAPPADQTMEKVKKRYRKKKTKLEEAFPSYLQEAFFGRDLLDRSRLVDRRPGPETPGAGQSGAATDETKGSTPGLHGLSAMTTNAIKKQGTLPMSEGALLDLSDVLNTDPYILATGHTAGLDISSMADDPSLTGSGGRGQRTLQEEPLDAILSPELDKMVTDGAILSKLYKIPELEGKDVEEVFTAVLSPNGSNSQSEQSQHTHTAAGSKTNPHHAAAAVFPRLPLMNGLMGAASHFHQTPMMPSGTQGPAGFRLPPPETPAPTPLRGPAPGLASANQGSAGEGEQDVMSTAQRSMLKWEKEETLGEMATVAPVLYCNTNFPQLREQYPDWSTRVKQIAKLWRKASSQDRAPFVQKARDNRAAQRINKVQLSNDPLKRHQPTQPPPPPLGPYDPVAMEMEGAFKDPLRPKETEQEQEWKLRQGEVNDRWGAGKKRQENLPQSKALKSPTDKDCPYQASVAGGGKEALQLRQMSKQQAKMEATQKLEQVKNEQLLQQRQQQQLLAGQRLAGQLSPDTDSRSPVAGGNASPLNLPASREGQCRQHLLLQGGQSSGQADDVFLRPQAPPPSGFSSLPHSPHPSSPLHQPPSSPQMFSPPSSRPSSPWDPYSKVVGTPRPASSQAGGLPAPQQQQRRNSLSASPAHDAFGSPAPSPDSKPTDISRVLVPQPGLQQRGAGMMSPSSGHVGLRAAENFQRTPPSSSSARVAVSELFSRTGEPVHGGLFKAPMPPQHQPQPEVFGGTGGGRRDPSRPTDLPFALPQAQDPAFPSSPLSGLGSPHRSPYAQTPGTPRPDYSQQINDPFTQQSPLTSRPSPDPYTNPQTPGTPRPHSDPTYLTTPPALRLDQFNQQSAGHRPSPSHPNIDPYSSNPGTPRPSISERFPRSPGSQRSTDPYTQPAGTPRPSPDPYAQQPSTPRPQKAPEPFSQNPVESFTPQPAASCSSPLAGGLSGETFTMTHHQMQQSPGRQHHQDFPRTPSSQTPKHPGMLDESSFSGLAGQNPGHDTFEQGHMTPGTPQMDKTTTNEMAALAVASLDTPMSMLPQLGDSEEKLRQRQRLRQLILRQQQQKSALRQEKGLQEAASGPPAAPPGPIPPSAPSRLWSQEDSSAPPTDMFGRPPPPYPGTVRPGGAVGPPAPRFPGGFPAEQQRGFNPNKGSLPRQSLPRELGVRGPALRFGLPPGPPAGVQDSFLHPPQGSVPGPVEFTGIRPLVASSAHMMPGIPQQFLPRSLPLQQHSIMGQPYIELRHRAPENRLRLPFPLPTGDSEHSVQPGQGNRLGETPLGQQMVMEQPNQQHQQHQQHVGHTGTLTQSSESALPAGDGMEEHLEGEDSAVKDLEDVEVKDLVDLNLNLDPEDGKEDLDLGPNDLHLDDFLLSGKFDLIAYADPELNLEDKKDMFNEELDLGEQVEEKEVGERKDGSSGTRKTDSHSYVGQVKQEVQDVAKTEARDVLSVAQQPASQAGLVTTTRPSRPPGAQATKVEDSGSASGAVPVSQNQDQAPSSGMAPRTHPPISGGPQSVFQQQQRPFGASLSSSALFSPHTQGLLVSPHPSLTPQDPPAPPHQLQPSQPHLLLNPQTQPAHPGTSTQTPTQAVFSQNQNQDQNKNRPLLLEEQPLLLQDLLDQERQEQQQQKQMQALIRQRPSPESVLPNMADFDSISDPIMKAKMVALKGINKVMTQGTLGLSPMVINRFQQAPVAPVAPVAPGPEGSPQPPHPVVQDGKLNPQLVRPNPPSFGPGFVNESQRRQYEEWLGETQQLLQMQQRLLEDQIAAHRKTKKSLSAKQRTAKKAGRPFAEEDATQLRNITEQQGAVQKQLEQIRKQQKDHAELIEDYRSKQQQQRALQPAAPLLSQPPASMQPRPGGPAPARAPNVTPGWPPGARAPGVMAQRMPPHLPPQMPPALPNTPPAPPHTQSPPVMLPGLTAPTAGFPAGPRGPTSGPSGAAGDGASRQVNFDDNNPFSEGFQERERRERLREQQERQRVQLMQEVERHRALQQRLELEQQGLLGASMAPGAAVAAMPPSGAPTGARVGQTPGPGGPAGSAPGPGGDTLSQMPFFSSELPQDFLQSPPASRPPPQHQDQAGALFAQQPGLHQGFTGGPLHPGAPLAPGLTPGATAELGRALPDHGPHIDVVPSNHQTRPRFAGPTGTSAQTQGHPAGLGSAGITLPHPGGQAHCFGHDSSSSSPSTPFPASFPCSSSGGPASLMQLYSDIIPDDKTKKKRSRKRDGDDSAGGGGARTPLSSQSDDITAPPTPAVSDTSCSTPTRGSMDQSDLSFSLSSSHCGLAPSSELERQLSVISAAQQRGPVLGMDPLRGPLSAGRLEVKEEREEGGACGGGVVKMEEGGGEGFSSPSPLHGGGKDGDAGKELLRHLLKDKTSPTPTPSPNNQAPPTACRQLSNESVRSEEEDRPGSHGNMVNSPDLLDPSGRKKTQRCKRVARPDKDRAPLKNKRRKKEEEENKLHSSTSSSSDPLMTHLTQLAVLPLMEPVLGVDLSLFPPYGSSSLGRDSRLSGSFGNACLDGVTDYYSQLIYKQNNLSNPPTPPASLPPTPPPVARQKLVNGFATTEELSRKDITEQDVKGVKQKGEGLLPLNHASKTVDVPASLPTPPHNNQEELRVQDSSERDSPDGFVPSSSPESVADMEVSRYPDLSFIKLEPPSPCPSPTLPIMPCAWGKASALKQEVKAEPSHQGPPSCSNTDLVTIAITLNPVAAQNVAGVMAAVAELLRVPVPVDYQLSRPAGPERSSLALLAGVRVPLTQGATGSRQQRPQPAAGNTGVRVNYIQHGGTAVAAVRPQCCNYCKGLLGNGVRIVKELKQEGQSKPGSSLVFCSPNCSALYTSDLQSRSAGNKAAEPVTLSGSEGPPPSRVQHQYTNNMSSIAVHTLLQTPSAPAPTSSSPPLSFPPASTITMETKTRVDSLKVKVKLKPRPRAVPGGEDSLSSRHLKRMKGCRWRRWGVSITLSRGPCIPNEAVAMPTEEEVDVLLKKLGACLRPDPLPKDQRRCCFCNQQGDGQTDGPARLLNLDLDLWVHLNCALWSSEVYETQAGALINVELALRRGLTLRCAHCQKTGATSGCNRLRCTNTYHFTCALQAHCTFFKDKTMLCHLHKPRMVPLSGDRSSSCSPSSTPGQTSDPAAMAVSDPYDSELRCFAVFRRVFVQRDEARQIAAVVQRGERQHTFRVGSLLFRSIGRLLPQQMNAFHNKTAIFPIGYHANRIYWSMRHSNRRCKYLCSIEEQEGQPLFKVKVVEKGYDDLIVTGPSPKAVWDQILEPVAQMRSSSGTLKLFPVYLKGEDLFGLTTSAVTRIIESLPGVETCERYTFRYGRNPLMEWPLAFNPSGSARSEPKAYQAKRPNLLTSVAPRCQGSVGSIVGLVPGVISLSPGETMAGAHQGRHSKSAQYRRMKAEWKTNVYLARSRIQGLGLYAARDIEKCTMVIEYIGTIIRSEVANRKERLYESQNRGVYMFRIDNDFVIDATITGGPARYINHSCSPNCITEVVTVEKENKIIISSCRRIQRGEELSYDYKFDLEDDQHKIPCHCGAVNCRKWMN
ncbi:histone-lysine N-methyltransferase 2C isoform 5-T5 [Acanthopagrus schlegelii]